MFCTKCGKKIDYEASVCNECAGVGQWFNADAQPNPNANNNYSNQGANNNGFYNDQNNAYNQGYNNYNNAYNQGYNNQYDQNYNTTYNQQSTYTPAPEKPKGSRKAGLKQGITAMIFGFLGMMFFIIALSVIGAILATSSYMDDAIFGAVFMGIIFSIPGFIFSVLGITKGIGAIKIFKTSYPKPIATLILGISSIYCAASGMVSIFYFVFEMLVMYMDVGF